MRWRPAAPQLSPSWNGFSWLMDVHMGTGQLLHAYVWSLGAFWPGLQVLAGQVRGWAGREGEGEGASQRLGGGGCGGRGFAPPA